MRSKTERKLIGGASTSAERVKKSSLRWIRMNGGSATSKLMCRAADSGDAKGVSERDPRLPVQMLARCGSDLYLEAERDHKRWTKANNKGVNR
jgi:hypothetical protein